MELPAAISTVVLQFFCSLFPLFLASAGCALPYFSNLLTVCRSVCRSGEFEVFFHVFLDSPLEAPACSVKLVTALYSFGKRSSYAGISHNITRPRKNLTVVFPFTTKGLREALGEDIKKFIVGAIKNSPPDWREDTTSTPGLQEEIVTILHEKANGMYALAPSPLELAPQVLIECYRFPWARLQVGQLLRLLFVSDIRGFLRKLPVTISTPEVLSSIFFPFPSLALGLRAIFWRLYLLGIIIPLN